MGSHKSHRRRKWDVSLKTDDLLCADQEAARSRYKSTWPSQTDVTEQNKVRAMDRQRDRPGSPWLCSYLGDAGVGALDVPAGPVQPGLVGGRAAVLAEGALRLAAAPAALELLIRFQAQAAALPLGRALVQVDCREERNNTVQRS